jgi:hypothetical protein
MTKLTKQHIADRDAIAQKLRDEREVLEKAIETFNTLRDEKYNLMASAIAEYNRALDEAFTPVGEAMDKYNATVSDANGWKEQIVSEIDEYISNKSDKWQESDKGNAVECWKESFQSQDVEEVELELGEPCEIPEELGTLEVDIEDGAEFLEQLPESPE